MRKINPRFFKIEGVTFCFENNPNYNLNEFSEPYRLMIFKDDFEWITINYPRNITEAKQLAKQYLIYS